MRVLILHEHGRPHGAGAVTAVYRLHTALRKAGIESTIACRRKAIDSPDVVELPRADRMENFLGVLSWRMGVNDIHCVSSFKIRKFKPFLDADIINIHGWHTNYFNFLALPGMARRKPIVGTMHDMWNLTGHCSQSYDCQRWKTGCGNCPYLGTFPPLAYDGTALAWKLKNWTYRRSDITFVAPSRWLLDCARESMIAQHDLRQIPNPVDHAIYRPLDQIACRDELGIPRDARVILFISVSIRAKAKGGDLLVQALESLPQHLKENSMLLLLGAEADELAASCGIPSKAMGYIVDDHRKATIYNAADVLVHPSRAENQSLVLLEAMACGTPVVAFDVGGNRELVDAGPCGMLAEPENPQQFSKAIATVLDDASLSQRFGEAARRVVCENYTLDLHCERYIKLFEEKIAAWRAAHGKT